MATKSKSVCLEDEILSILGEYNSTIGYIERELKKREIDFTREELGRSILKLIITDKALIDIAHTYIMDATVPNKHSSSGLSEALSLIITSISKGKAAV